MQQLIAKYGLAAHLAILAVAPLFLFPFAGEASTAVVLLWLSVSGCAWMILEPSVRGRETLHEARRRVSRAIFVDPLFWASLVLMAFAGLRCLNTGISLAYDAENAVWHIAEPVFPILPGCVGDAGRLPFAVIVAFGVCLQGCRHSLGRSARAAFLLIGSCLAGLSAVITLVAAYYGAAGALAAINTPPGAFSYVGFAFGLYLLGGTVALLAVFERGWKWVVPLIFLSVGGTAAGLFAFSPVRISAFVGLVEVVLLTYTFAYSCRTLRAAGEFKLLVVGGISFVMGGLLVALVMPEASLSERLSSYLALQFLPEEYWNVRALLSGICFKSWMSHLWIGTGLSSFPLDFRFGAVDADWVALPRGAVLTANGWWHILAERGLVGIAFFVMPFGFLLFTYFRRLVDGVRLREMPHPACLLGLMAISCFAAVGFFDCSILRGDVLMAVGSMLVVSAATFSRRKNRG